MSLETEGWARSRGRIWSRSYPLSILLLNFWLCNADYTLLSTESILLLDSWICNAELVSGLLVVHSLGFSFFKGLFGVSLTLSPCDCQLKPSKPLLKNLVGNFSTMFNIRKWHLSCGQFSGSSLGLETK